MIAGNLVEIRLPKTQSRKCLWKSNLWRYKAENVFGSLISTKLEQGTLNKALVFWQIYEN
jgi:hypothetical protein